MSTRLGIEEVELVQVHRVTKSKIIQAGLLVLAASALVTGLAGLDFASVKDEVADLTIGAVILCLLLGQVAASIGRHLHLRSLADTTPDRATAAAAVRHRLHQPRRPQLGGAAGDEHAVLPAGRRIQGRGGRRRDGRRSRQLRGPDRLDGGDPWVRARHPGARSHVRDRRYGGRFVAAPARRAVGARRRRDPGAHRAEAPGEGDAGLRRGEGRARARCRHRPRWRWWSGATR